MQVDAMQNPVLHMEGIQRSFGGVHALRGVDLDLYPGEVLALVGENGAGKSTLVEVLVGNVKHDTGRIVYKDHPVHFSGAREAAFAGVSIVHQELSLVAELTVAENIFCAREPVYPYTGFVNRHRLYQEAEEILQRFGLDVSPKALVGRLSVAVQQMIEIAKALSLECQVLALDEPTSALTEREAKTLFGIINRLRERGVAIIYISHKLPEVFQIADRIQVLRDGQLVGVRNKSETTPDEIVRMMVGRELGSGFPERSKTPPGEPLLCVTNLTRPPRFFDVSFDLRPGEILGVAGLVGAGRTEVARAIFGIDRAQSGKILLEGNPIQVGTPEQAIDLGIGYVPEDRKDLGLFLGLTVRTNIGAASLKRNSVAGFMSAKREQNMAEEYVQRLNICTPGIDTITSNLSGGNQQKVMLAKWLAINPRVLLVDEPTRGVDVGAKSEVHIILRKLADAGTAVMMISSELPEILGASDRIMVMHEGQVTGFLNADEATEEDVMFLAAGHRNFVSPV